MVFVGEEWSQQGLRVKRKGERLENIKSTQLTLLPLTLSPSIDVLFVAFGFPKQEEWMYNNIDMLNVRVMMGVGGAFDYISGKVPRAPGFIRRFGFEWLYGLLRQPWRFQRQLALIEFIWLVLKDILKSKRFSSPEGED